MTGPTWRRGRPAVVGELDDDVGEADLLVEEHLGRAQHGQRGEVGGVEEVQPLLPRPARERLRRQLPGGVVLVVVERHRHLRSVDRRARARPSRARPWSA